MDPIIIARLDRVGLPLTSKANCVSTIKVGDQLNDTSQLVSPGKIFTLGFFTIPATNNTYLGIWYTNVRRSRKVWVANPSIPINISSYGILMIDPDNGILIITTGGTTLVNISDNESGHGQNLTATLEDTAAPTTGKLSTVVKR
ncbi:Bulb-type lectin domain-containing protein [Cynara cardunculus var. scolymus]|uniref:Bulb-type lectin domain-containing protein n=1 Tax=Cynara cardunculus var. scolymus TaxID=59895 RepID=A0A103XIX8_CYNCS|nr:Bulb-type lectin domain-containing protein [Cynara cardunculus var. scolymus]